MEILYYIIVPIITSIIGGAVGGLFTFLGVKMTLTNEKKNREEELKSLNIEKNKKIALTKPEMTITENEEDIKEIEEICLLPYVKPELFDKEKIIFNYTEEIYNEVTWDKYEIVLQNTGKRKINSAFLQIPYKSEVNIYTKSELMAWPNEYIINYYSDTAYLPNYISPDEKIKLIIYFPKDNKRLENLALDLYINDEDDNCWFQRCVNGINKIDPEIISPEAFRMHLRQDYYYWLIYDSLYYSKNVKRNFRVNIQDLLEERKKTCWDENKKHEAFVYEVKKGLKLLNYKLPLD